MLLTVRRVERHMGHESVPERADQALRFRATSEDLEVPPAAIEAVLARRETSCRQHRREDHRCTDHVFILDTKGPAEAGP